MSLNKVQTGEDRSLDSTGHRTPRAGTAILAALFMLAGCAGASVKESNVAETGALSKPNQIVVYEFSYSPEQEPGTGEQRELTEEEEQVGRQVASLVADAMIDELNDKSGISTVSASSATLPSGDTLIVEGEFLSISEGSGAARVIVGFGAGRSKLVTKARAFHMSGGAKTLVGEYDLSADSGFMPGLISGAPGGVEGVAAAGAGVGLDVAIGNDTIADARRTGEELAEELIKVMQDKGWVPKEG